MASSQEFPRLVASLGKDATWLGGGVESGGHQQRRRGCRLVGRGERNGKKDASEAPLHAPRPREKQSTTTYMETVQGKRPRAASEHAASIGGLPRACTVSGGS